jgi:hypothetical protein
MTCVGLFAIEISMRKCLLGCVLGALLLCGACRQPTNDKDTSGRDAGRAPSPAPTVDRSPGTDEPWRDRGASRDPSSAAVKDTNETIVASDSRGDATPASVAVRASPGVREAGLGVARAMRDKTSDKSRKIVLYLSAARDFHGRLSLAATDDQELPTRALRVEAFEAKKGETRQLEFEFDESASISAVDAFLLDMAADKPVDVSDPVAAQEIAFSQLSERESETGPEVTLYVIFGKAFKKGLSLRAYDASGAEVGRSKEAPALDQKADSAVYLTFQFDPRVPIRHVASYKVFDAPGAKPPASASSADSPAPPKPFRVRSNTALVPKNP